jgi:hypothetical protein
MTTEFDVSSSAVARFAERVESDWLPTYCQDAARRYDPKGYKKASMKLAESDAKDCMLAIDQRIVIDLGGGRWRAALSSADEVLFWEGRKDTSPRPITLWLEPVITFAALARLHVVFGWPKEYLAMQPKGWAFDLAAYDGGNLGRPHILGEVKKSSSELRRLNDELLALSENQSTAAVSRNSAKKWQALVETAPSIVWLLGPNEESYVYQPFVADGSCTLIRRDASALAYRSGRPNRSASEA